MSSIAKSYRKNLTGFLIAVFAIFGQAKIHSQQYEPLLNGFNEWHFTNCYFGCLTDTYFTNGDTIVNNKTRDESSVRCNWTCHEA